MTKKFGSFTGRFFSFRQICNLPERILNLALLSKIISLSGKNRNRILWHQSPPEE